MTTATPSSPPANGAERPRVIDMRSDTVTRPTPAMRQAMVEAEVGDDVYGDDPTVNALEARAAAMVGKESALFVPSGTMGNLISVLTHCQRRGDEYIVGDQSHIHCYEQGGTASLGSVHPRVIPTLVDGSLALVDIENAIRPVLDDHFPITRLVCIENTHNRMGGRVLSKAYVDSVGDLAHKHGLQFHIDGARIFNACVKLGVDVKDMCEKADSVSICLSKGLAAPVGSIIVGTKDFIKDCRRLRKALGGGMRQAGVLAAAAMVSLDTMVDRLADDHTNALTLAKGVSSIPGLETDLAGVETNLVFVTITKEFPLTASELKTWLATKNILIGVTAIDKVRFVAHWQITSDDVETVVQAVKEIAAESKH